MTDPRDFDRGPDRDRWMAMDRRMGAPTPWGWIAGAVFVVLILTLIFGGNMGTRTALDDNASPPETTGMATRTAPPAVPVPPQTPPGPAQGMQ
jgi:hypothetical protein